MNKKIEPPSQAELDDDQEAQRLQRLNPSDFINENLNPPFEIKLTENERSAFAYAFDCAQGFERFNRQKYNDLLKGKYIGDADETNRAHK